MVHAVIPPRALAGLVVALGVAGTLGAAVVAQADRAVPFRVGEVLTYDVAWSTFLKAGEATLSVREQRSGTRGPAQYLLVAEGRPTPLIQQLYPLYYKAESLVDTRTLQPSLASLFSDENGRRRHKISTFAAPGVVDYQAGTPDSPTTRLAVHPNTFDPLAAIYRLRALPLRPASPAFSLAVTDSGRTYAARVIVGAREPVTTGMGIIPGLKLTLVVRSVPDADEAPTSIDVWLSDDARRLPLKIVSALAVGSIQLTLTKAERQP